MVKRLFDIFSSLLGFVILLPFLIAISVLIFVNSRGGVFYRQIRVGKNGKDFKLWKFRTMQPDSDKNGLLTVGGRDARITSLGYYLRKYKLDELPQLMNVFVGEMSIVGPRPEVRKYVELYTLEQLHVLDVQPGITDYASIEYANENDLLAESSDPENRYIQQVMPEKLKLNMKYIADKSLGTDLKIIFRTLGKIIFKSEPK